MTLLQKNVSAMDVNISSQITRKRNGIRDWGNGNPYGVVKLPVN